MTPKNKISKQWRLWISSNLEKGVSKDYIFNALLENGFSYEAVKKEIRHEIKIKQIIPEIWKKWLLDNISLQKDKDGLFKVLLMHGFAYDSIREEMQYQPSVPLEKLKDPFDTAREQVRCFDAIQKSISRLSRNAIKLKTEKLNIFYLESFINETDCDYLIELIRSQHQPSKLTSPDADKLFRTSSTCDLNQFNDDIVRNIDKQICDLVGIENKFSEPIQGQFYEVGQEFKPHTDYFEEHEINDNGGLLGQRSFTVMIYLNSTQKGGETAFPLVDQEFTPTRGKAIVWCNLNRDCSPNNYSMHHAKKVQDGYKAIITKWFRTGIPMSA